MSTLVGDPILETLVRVDVPDATFRRFLRLPAHREWKGPLAENATWARAWFAAEARPWRCAVRDPEDANAWLLAASAGPETAHETARRWTAEEPDRYYFLECYAAAAVATMVQELAERLDAPALEFPGFRDGNVHDNAALLARVRSAVALPAPLEVLSSGMLMPKHSQLARARRTRP